MKDTEKNIRNLMVLLASCLLCTFFGLLMGLSIPGASSKPSSQEEESTEKGVVLLSDHVNSAEFEKTVEPFLSYPGVVNHNVMGTPLRLIKITLYKALKNDLGKKDALLLEKGLMNVGESLFFSFADVPADVCDACRYDMFALLGLLDKGPRFENIYVFGVIGDDGGSITSLVLFIPYPDLQIVQLNGDINPEMFNISSDK